MEAEQYLLDGIENWRRLMGLEKFVMCGHSMGGYMAAKYAQQNPGRVIALILISPAGLWPTPPNFKQELMQVLNSMNAVHKFVLLRALEYWHPGRSPLQILRGFGRTSSLLIERYVSLFPNLAEEVSCDEPPRFCGRRGRT